MIIHIGAEPSFGKDELSKFLRGCDYRRFNLWPNVHAEQVADFLFEEINGIPDKNKIMVFYKHKLIVLLTLYFLDWDTQHFGFKCAHISYLLVKRNTEQSVTRKCLKQSLDCFRKYCQESGIRFVSANIDSWDYDVSFALQEAGFRYVLTWADGIIKESRELADLVDGAEIGLVKPAEIDQFSVMSAKHYFRGGRFYADPGFETSKINEMYAKLVISSFERGDILLAYRIRGNPAGLFICKKVISYKQFSGLRVAPLRFLIVDPKYRHKGIAQDLFSKTVMYLDNISDLVTTGFEIHNLPSLNLHVKLGFKLNFFHNLYHWWGSL